MGWSWEALGHRPGFFVVVGWLVGVGLGPHADVPAWGWLGAATALLALATWLGRRPGALLSVLGASVLLGAGLASLRVEADEPAPGARLVVEGDVEQVGEHSLSLNVTAADGVPARFRAALTAEPLPAVLAGQRVRVEARLRPLVEAANPGEWSRAEWAWRRGQSATGSFKSARLVALSPAPAWRAWLAQRHASLRRQTRALGGDEAATALLLTLSAGERAALGEELEEVFARSGLAHVLSVSGLHVAVLALTAYRLLRWTLTRRQARWLRALDPRQVAAPLSLPLVWGYVLFTGLQAPAVRSAIMCTLLLGGAALRRRSDPLNALALAALGMTAVDPAAPWELSVQLSFVAVLALVLLGPGLRRLVPVPFPAPSRQRGWALRLAEAREAVLQTLAASVAVTLATAPIVLAAFQRVSLAGLASNVVALPLSGVLTVVAAAGAALHLAWEPLATPALWLGLQLSELFVALAQAFARVPGGTVSSSAPAWPVALAWWAGLTAAVFLRGRARWWSALAPAALAAHLLLPVGVARGVVEVTFLAVGHGDAIVVSSDGHHALIDGGGVPEGHDTGRRFVLPFLKQRRIEALELAALSHAHPDHALGLAAVLEEVPTRRLWVHADSEPGPLLDALLDAAGDAEVEEREAGDAPLRLGAATVEVLGPPRDRAPLDSENDRSLVLLVRHGAVSVLLTGDLEAAGEAALAVGPVTVVKASHHGSDTSSTPDFVARTRPRHVVFCVGRHNRFDFPRADVVRRWREAGARCYRTDLDGAVTFRSDGRDVEVETFRPAGERHARRRLAGSAR